MRRSEEYRPLSKSDPMGLSVVHPFKLGSYLKENQNVDYGKLSCPDLPLITIERIFYAGTR